MKMVMTTCSVKASTRPAKPGLSVSLPITARNAALMATRSARTFEITNRQLLKMKDKKQECPY